MGRGGRAVPVADAAAEPAGRRRPQPDELRRQPGDHLDAGRADCRSDQQGAPGGRGDGRPGRGVQRHRRRPAGPRLLMVLRAEDANRVRTLTLARPGALNAFNEELYDALADALLDAVSDPSVAVVLLTGEGRAFSAGTDLLEMQIGRASGRGRVDKYG